MKIKPTLKVLRQPLQILLDKIKTIGTRKPKVAVPVDPDPGPTPVKKQKN